MTTHWTKDKPTVPVTRETHSLEQVRQRIMEKVELVTESGCWIWTGATKGDEEYGRVYIGQKSFHVHRLLYEIERGIVPVGLVLDHLCRVRICVNPEHLEVVTNRTNILRGRAPGVLRMNSTTCLNGHALDGDNTRLYRYKSGRIQKCCRICERLRSQERRYAMDKN